MEEIKWVANKNTQLAEKAAVDFLGEQEIVKALIFHQSFPEYARTPLHSLPELARYLGVKGVYLKDESYRFGLKAFKVLGGSYAIGRYLAQRLGRDISELDFPRLTSPEIREELGEITFTTATDGNHGRGVAWTAGRLKQKSVIYMPKGSSLIRLESIRSEGAEASITDLNYDDAVRMAAGKAAQNDWVVVQDTAWAGYEDIPTWIMQGYGSMAAEASEQLNELGIAKPTHVFAQAGVGSLAGAIQGFFAAKFGEERPKTVIVEADQADCFYRSILSQNPEPQGVGGDMITIMAGLACGEPNTISWPVLRDYSDLFFSCPDWVSAKGMRVLGNPLNGDPAVTSGESGAVSTGLLFELMKNRQLAEAREVLGLDSESEVLLFSTEGDTDPEMYRRIVWDGWYCSE